MTMNYIERETLRCVQAIQFKAEDPTTHWHCHVHDDGIWAGLPHYVPGPDNTSIVDMEDPTWVLVNNRDWIVLWPGGRLTVITDNEFGSHFDALVPDAG